MSSLPRPPASCADLDLAVVERVLAKHYGDITGAARELGVSGPDLKRLTWAKPELLEEAELERMGGYFTGMACSDHRARQRRLVSQDVGLGQDHVELDCARSSACAGQARATGGKPGDDLRFEVGVGAV
jgi:hypothetical protein